MPDPDDPTIPGVTCSWCGRPGEQRDSVVVHAVSGDVVTDACTLGTEGWRVLLTGLAWYDLGA